MSTTNPLVSKFHDDEDMRDLLDMFAGQLPDKVAKMQRMMSEGDIQNLRTVCHQLKGAGGGYGFDCITELAAKAEAPLKAGATIEQVKGEIQALIDLLRSVEGYDQKLEKIPSPAN